jgi:hypothetical protein
MWANLRGASDQQPQALRGLLISTSLIRSLFSSAVKVTPPFLAPIDVVGYGVTMRNLFLFVERLRFR